MRCCGLLTDMAMYKGKCEALVNTIMNFLVP
jgi:hypothetical protein